MSHNKIIFIGLILLQTVSFQAKGSHALYEEGKFKEFHFGQGYKPPEQEQDPSDQYLPARVIKSDETLGCYYEKEATPSESRKKMKLLNPVENTNEGAKKKATGTGQKPGSDKPALE